MRQHVKTVRTLKDLSKAVSAWRRSGDSIALVPTMGALHEGHLALVRTGKSKCRRVVVSIFVNPTQFAPHEDLARYPRDEAGDVAKLADAGADLVWAPSVEEMYPDGMATRVVPEGAALPLEGAFRPHHFAGVATVCAKLFNQVRPDCALFGEKDYQQLCVIRQLARDLDLPLRIIGVPTVREKDGLALSSRNAYLTPEERRIAPTLHRTISALAQELGADPAGPTPHGVATLCSAAAQRLLAAEFTKIDYVAARDAETLAPLDMASGRPGRVLAAVWLGKTRLIDNVPVARAKRVAKSGPR